MSNAKTKKKRRALSTLVSLCLIVGASFFLYQAFQEIVNTYNLTKELQTAKSILDDISNENKYLNEQKTKLLDPEYVKSYARGTYMLSKEGEQIFYLPSKD
ncbi:MAG: septum formation initiator family protein [Erysipelotrichaceae bacterium]|nr:septum formation initiator family protein [Erysipelotrichaceae bacterium]